MTHDSTLPSSYWRTRGAEAMTALREEDGGVAAS